MFSILMKILGLSATEISTDDLKNGTIVDVRTASEFSTGHVAGSVNIPLQGLDRSLSKLRQLNSPIIACCASGNRSGMATRKLNSLGIKAINGGSWHNVNRQIKKA